MKNILVAIDFSKKTDAVLKQAAALSKALGAKLWILHVTTDEAQALMFEATQYSSFSAGFGGEDMPIITPGQIQAAQDINAMETRREHKELQHITAHLRDKGLEVQGVLAEGDPGKLIVAKAEEVKADILILGSHGHGCLLKALLGSVSEAVMSHARCNVMVVPTRDD